VRFFYAKGVRMKIDETQTPGQRLSDQQYRIVMERLRWAQLPPCATLTGGETKVRETHSFRWKLGAWLRKIARRLRPCGCNNSGFDQVQITKSVEK
jgi:hypothetical protein